MSNHAQPDFFETGQGGVLRVAPMPTHAQPTDRFNGADYDHARDSARLTGQLQRVFSAISGGAWLTLATISNITGDPPASVSAQLRHLRKPRFGGHTIERRHVGGGLYEYRHNGVRGGVTASGTPYPGQPC